MFSIRKKTALAVGILSCLVSNGGAEVWKVDMKETVDETVYDVVVLGGSSRAVQAALAAKREAPAKRVFIAMPRALPAEDLAEALRIDVAFKTDPVPA